MGLFGFIGKVAKGVAKIGVGAAKAALGKATFGASDAVFGALKQRGDVKRAERQQEYNMQQLALAEKMRPLTPRVRRTEAVLDEATRPPRQLSKAEIYGRQGYSYSRANMTLAHKDPTVPTRRDGGNGYQESRQPPARSRTTQRPRATVPASARGRPTPRKPAKPRSARKPPTGGLDLKALSQSWNAAGKPGTWQGWIAQNK